MQMPAIGDVAPDFSLPDQDKELVNLGALRGRPVLLVFFPLAFSSTCQRELCAIRDDFGAYEARGVTVLGVSVDSTYALRAWRRDQGFTHRLLSDRWPLGEVIRRYGAWNEQKGHADRASFLVDEDGVIRWMVHNSPDDAREEAAYVRAIDMLVGGAPGDA
jgi:peroxiredoxin